MALNKVIIKNIDKADLEAAIACAITADQYYREAIDQRKKVVLDVKFQVHETDKGTIVVTYAKN